MCKIACKVASLAICFLTLAACDGKETCTEIGAMRCNQSAVEVCSSATEWEQVMSCLAIKSQDDSGPWACCNLDAGMATCLPKDRCSNAPIK